MLQHRGYTENYLCKQGNGLWCCYVVLPNISGFQIFKVFALMSVPLFLKHGGQILVEVTGKRRNKGIGLEIPATYSFYHKKPSKVKLIEIIREALIDNMNPLFIYFFFQPSRRPVNGS